MDPPDVEPQDIRDPGRDAAGPGFDDRATGPHGDDAGADWLEEVVERLEADPRECRPAIESLATLDEETRARVIAALAVHADRPAIGALLRLAGVEPPPSTRTASSLTAIPAGDGGRDLATARGPLAGRIVHSLVTAVDGEGRGTIVLSARDGADRRTAAFQTDVRRGILDAIGEVEPEGPSAGRLLEEWLEPTAGECARDVPELALRLLGGCLVLTGRDVPASVRTWLEATIGPGPLAAGLPAALPGVELVVVPVDELPSRANEILDACPDWLDRSPLTYEIAAEIAVREGARPPDPARDAGAYRYLFEHRLIDRLDSFARMLLWMGWVWHASGRHELARSAFALAGQLADQQYAVPSHPFAVALTTRSLQAAQEPLHRGGHRVPRR